MLQWNPKQRISVEDAILHPYLTSLHDINDEPICEHKLEQGDFEKSAATLSVDEARRILLEECLVFHPELRQEWTPLLDDLRARAEGEASGDESS